MAKKRQRTREAQLYSGLPQTNAEKGGLGNRKLIAWDHNRDQMYQCASTLLDDPKAAQYVWGIGYH